MTVTKIKVNLVIITVINCHKIYRMLSFPKIPAKKALAFGDIFPAKARLYSDPMKCVKKEENNPAKLTLNFLVSGSLSITLCRLNFHTLTLEKCGETTPKFQKVLTPLTLTQDLPVKNEDMEYFVRKSCIFQLISYFADETSVGNCYRSRNKQRICSIDRFFLFRNRL